MAIECVNTIEIRLCETLDSTFAEMAGDYIERLQEAPGCLDYTLTRSKREAGAWWLTGYWEGELQMTDSFNSAQMAWLLDWLVAASASMTFGSYASQTAVSHGN